jgi:hypothetical protein
MHKAYFYSKYALKANVTSPRQGMLVYKGSTGELELASNVNFPLGFLFDEQKLVPSTTANYPLTNSNDLTNMLGLVTGVCRKGTTICDGSYFTNGETTGDALVDGDMVAVDTNGLIVKATGNVGCGRFLGALTDQYSAKRYIVRWDFMSPAGDIA